MSTFQPNQSNGFSPILLSPSSTSNATITNNHPVLFDNSDQGSVDSDYTSLGSSKFYGNGGSSSSLHRQGRSQSIDELASTTTIPTRHFNGTLNVNKLNNDPLQFVKIHPNHDLIERAQEQLTLLESRKRLQETFKLNNLNRNHNDNLHNNTNSSKMNDDDDTDWSKAVENWRQKREQKRKQSVNPNHIDDESPISIPNNESSPPSPTKKFDEPQTKPAHSSSSPPPLPPSSPVVSVSSSTNLSTAQLVIPNRTASKSPSPQRIKGPAKIHEIFIKKAVEIRGFGFKLEGGPAQKRPIYISTIEESSPADKAGLCVEDEIVSMNDEIIEHMTFDQVRKILKERNLRGSIKLIVKTYEDIVDDNSQTITAGLTTEHSRTPSPQKPVPTSQSTTPAPPASPTARPIQAATPTSPANVHSPVYTFLPYTPLSTTPSIPPSDTIINTPIQQTSTSSLNMFTPKPFRSTASVNLDTPNHHETNITHSSPIEAFRKMLNPSNSISKSMQNETIEPVEQQSSNVAKSIPRDTVNTPPANLTSVSVNLTNPPPPPPPPITIKSKLPPPPLASVESLLQETLDINSHDQPRNESLIGQARSSVEQQMNQTQQDLLRAFPQPQISREQRPVSIPIDFSPALASNQQPDSAVTNNNRIYGIKVNPNEHAIHYMTPSNQPRSSPSYPKRSLQDIPSIPTVITNRPLTAHSSDRAINEIKVNLSPPTLISPQRKIPIQLDEKKAQQRITNKQLHTTLNQVPKKSQHDDHSWITNDQKKSIVISSSAAQLSSQKNGKNIGAHRPPPPVPHHQELQINIPTAEQLSMFHYGDHADELHYRPLRSLPQQQEFDPSINRHQPSKNRSKSPIRTTINSNNNRVLSVSGKLHCSKCSEELGQGSAMVIESLGLYYHIECFRCFVCNIPLSSSFEGTDVRVRSNRLHCQNCFSDENGVKLSAV